MACEGFIEEHHAFMLKKIRKNMWQTQEVINGISEYLECICDCVDIVSL